MDQQKKEPLPLTFRDFQAANAARCIQSFHKVEDWTPNDWMTALVGEVGEAANILKKMRRLEDGTNTAKDPQSIEECIALIEPELGDIQTYLDLIATRLGINLEKVTREKFNVVSDRMGSAIKL